MKIVCGSCGAKYSIADEKVQGKVFKIRCRKCSNVIVVKGTAEDGDEADMASSGAYSAEAAPEWYIVIDGEQAGPLTVADVEDHYSAGRVTADSYMWRDGMTDWTRLADVEGFTHLGGEGLSAAAAYSEPNYASEPTAVADAHDWNAYGASEPEPATGGYGDYSGADDTYGQAASSTYNPDDPYGDPTSSAGFGSVGFGDEPAAPSYQESSASGAGYNATADQGGGLFSTFDADQGNAGGLAYQSFSGLDSLKSSGVDMGSGPSGGGASSGRSAGGEFSTANDLVGSRNENSVLFSLSSLQQVEAVKSKPDDQPLTEGSGLIDIQSLATTHKQISSGGLGGPSSSAFGGPAAPSSPEVFAPATMSVPAIMPRGTHRDNKGLVVAVAGLAFLLIGGLIAVVVVLSNKDNDAPQIVERVEYRDREVAAAPINDKEAQAAAIAEAARMLADQQRAEALAAKEKNAEEEEEDNGPGKSTKSTKTTKTTKSDSSTRVEARNDTTPPASNTTKGKGKDDIDDLLGKLDNKKDPPKSDPKTPPVAVAPNDSSSGGAVKDKLSKPDVQNTVKKYNGKIAGCSKDSNSGGLKGMVWVGFRVESDGGVTGASITSKSAKFQGTDVGNCIVGVVRTMKFPAAKEPTPISGYPFSI